MRLPRLLASALGAGAAAAEVAQRYGAVPIVPGALVPRYVADRSLPLLKRDGSCGDGNHPCRDIEHADQCCPNDNYCYVNKAGDPKCCPIGSNCVSDSNCSSDAYFCNATVTPTASGASASTAEACCGRVCTATSQYLCPDDLGGKCCPYGFECRPSGNCVTTEPPSSTSDEALLTPIVEGCSTKQHSCADGTGCCDNDRVCTQTSGSAYCALGTPTGSGISVVDDDDDGGGGLSDGAKAGIAVGVVVGAGLIAGSAAWLFISKRRRRPQSLTQPSGSGGGGVEEQQTGAGDDPAMTDVTGPSGRTGRGRGLTQDYFGPDPVPGPYTETVASSPGPGRAVPSQPQQPGDIAPPVEIDSKHDPLTPSSVGAAAYETPRPDTVDGRFELHEAATPSSTGAAAYESPRSDTIDGRFELYGADSLQVPEPAPALLPEPSPRSEDERPERS